MIKFIKRNYEYLIFSFFVTSFLGWIMEVLYSLVVRHHFTFPGAMLGPYLPIYGGTFVLLILLIRKKDNIIINFIKGGLVASCMEYVISFISGELFNHVIWDYSDKFLNLNGRICLEMSLMFATLAIIFIYIFYPFLRRIYIKIKPYVETFNITLIIIFILDITVNTIWV